MYGIKKLTTMELLSIEEIDFERLQLTAVFDGLFQGGFYVKTDFDYEKEQDEFYDEDLGLKDYFLPNNITFWDWKVFNSEEEPISINKREEDKIKRLVENKLDDLLTEYLND